MLYPFRYYRHLIPRIIPSQKGKPPVNHYYQGKDTLYFGISFNLTRAHFLIREKI